ncbi:MAG: M48 family metalloprotease [Acidimicrobiales bacterium]
MVSTAVSHQPLHQDPVPTTGPSLTGRAVLALAFLVGFYALALGAVAALVGANVALYAMAGRMQAQLVIVTVFVAGAVLRGLFFIARSDIAELPGVEVDEHSQPELVGLVRSVATEMGTAPPDRILFVPEVNASVTQTGGLLGLRRGERVMVVGVPLVHSLTVDQLRGVIAHELGHYTGGDTRLGALTYRAGASIYRTVDNLGHDSLLGRLFAAYGSRFLLISQRVRRQQELSADAAAVRLAGAENHIAALRRVEATAAAFDHFLRHYLAPLWRRGCDAGNAFDGYRALLADPGRAGELARVEAAAHERVADRFDSHPSLAERVAHASQLPEGPSAGHDGRPARDLLAQADDVERQVGRLLTREVTGRQMDRVVEWDASAAEVFAADLREDADALLRATAAVVGRPDEPATLAATVGLIEAGRAGELAAALTGPLDGGAPSEQDTLRQELLRHHLGSAIGAYLAAERGHAWAISWSGPLGLVDGKGKAKDPFALAAALLDDPMSAPKLRRSLGGVTRLATFGAPPVEETTERQPELPEVVHVVPDLEGRRQHFDAVLTTTSLVLHPITGEMGHAIRRLMRTQGVGGPAAGAARKRFERLFSLPAAQVLGAAPGAVVLAFADMRQLRRRRGWVVEVEMAGETKPWRLRCPSKADRDQLLEAMQHLVLGDVASPQPVAA